MQFWNVTQKVRKGFGRKFESKLETGDMKLWSQVLNMEQFFCEQVLMQIYGCTSALSHRSTGAH